MVVFGTVGGRNGNEGRLQVDGLGVGAARNGGGVSGLQRRHRQRPGNLVHGLRWSRWRPRSRDPRCSVVPKTGGNTVKGSVYLAGVSSRMVGNNYTDELRNAGLSAPGKLLKLWDFTGGVGGPIKKDRLWSFPELSGIRARTNL